MELKLDAKDLLVGSYVQNMALEVKIVSEITQDGFIRTSTLDGKQYFNFTSLERFQPIPISAEWLMKLGFEKNSNSNRYELWEPGPLHLFITTTANFIHADEIILRLSDCDKKMYSLTVESVHHLQQILWSLERIWLTIQPPTPP